MCAGVTEDDGADRLFVEVERDALHAAFELEQFVDRRAREAADAGDAVADFDDATDLRRRGRRADSREPLAQRGGDVVGFDVEAKQTRATRFP